MLVEKVIVRKTRKEEVISQWMKPKGFDLSVCTLSLPAFKLSLNLFFGGFKEFKRFMNTENPDFKIEFDDAIGFYIQVKKDGMMYHSMCITSNNWTAPDYSTICHELHHFVHFGLDEKGLNYGIGGEEAYAYIQGYFMELTVRAFVELRKIKKIK